MSRGLRSPRPASPSARLDAHLIELLERLGEPLGEDLRALVRLLCRRMRAGDVCLDVTALACGRDLPLDDDEPAPRFGDRGGLLEALRRNVLVGDGSALRPLVLDPGGRLYLFRYWQHEQRLIAELSRRVAQPVDEVDASWLRPALDRLFPPSLPAGALDWQRVAAAVAMLRPLCAISGGPGTGKTHTVTKVLALLVERARAGGQPWPRLVLLAPTGKAAQRLVESVRAAKGSLPCDDAIRDAIPEQAATLHRALGSIPGSRTRFRHGPDQPLAADAVLVDEASMVDVGMMARLLAALRPAARLILIGDRDQLASVEAGSVLGDLCLAGVPLHATPALRRALEGLAGLELPAPEPGAVASAVGDSVVTLRHSYRHAGSGQVGELARVLNAQQVEVLVQGLREARWPGVTWVETGAREPLPAALLEQAAAHGRAVRDAPSAADALRRLGRMRVLCALRRGPAGVERVNRLLEQEVLGAAAVDGVLDVAGRPVLVTHNDYGVQLFNGDVGVLWPDAQGVLRACFEGGADGALRALAPSWLPPHETVYAMTVHKSQGSEFDEVAVVLPPEPAPVLTVELLYTAVTRARARVTVYASEAVLRHTVGRRVQRRSGLRAALWGEDLAGGR